jgi:hypothetical protein
MLLRNNKTSAGEMKWKQFLSPKAVKNCHSWRQRDSIRRRLRQAPFDGKSVAKKDIRRKKEREKKNGIVYQRGKRRFKVGWKKPSGIQSCLFSEVFRQAKRMKAGTADNEGSGFQAELKTQKPSSSLPPTQSRGEMKQSVSRMQRMSHFSFFAWETWKVSALKLELKLNLNAVGKARNCSFLPLTASFLPWAPPTLVPAEDH